MRTHHKPPSLVSMWMLDVFCCALGCVILLLLLKMRETSIIAEEAAQTSSSLDETKSLLIESQSDNKLLVRNLSDRERNLALLLRERDELAKTLALVRNQRDLLADKLAVVENDVKSSEANLAATRQKLDDTAKMLAISKEKIVATEADLLLKKSDIDRLTKKMDEAVKTEADLLQLIRDKEKLKTDALKQALDLSDRLLNLEKKLATSNKAIDDLTTKSVDASKLRARVADLEKLVADANVTIVDLQGTKAKLADKIDKLQIEAEQRFAGIALSGKNVVFLIDISGSMVLTDANTPDPTKWPIVRDTVVKVMRSLPTLERFQVILFSRKAGYLLGEEGRWMAYEGEKSIARIKDALTSVKVEGDTNLYLGLNEAFAFRPKGLDTIYLFSDGLPTSGPGLTAQEERTLGDDERSTILSRHLRKLLKTEWNKPSLERPRVRINSIGFFYESPDVGAFLWALSRENDGSFVGMSRP